MKISSDRLQQGQYGQRVTHLMNRSGSTVVEASISMVCLLVLLTGGLNFSYLVFAYSWIDHVGYEALICLSTPAETSQCDQRFRQKTKTALPVGAISFLELTRDSRRAKIDARFRLLGRDVIHYHDQRSLPLIAAGSSHE